MEIDKIDKDKQVALWPAQILSANGQRRRRDRFREGKQRLCAKVFRDDHPAASDEQWSARTRSK